MTIKEENIKINIGHTNEIIKKRETVAYIDPKLCVNCGKCRRMCPTEAIEELQRIICRQCPDCAESEIMFHHEAKEYAPKHACSIACPLGTIPEGYVNLIAEGKFEDAYDLVRELNPLPSICGRICDAPCEEDCKRGLLIDNPINIRGLKRFVTDKYGKKEIHFNTRYDTKIAIVGAGPAGITAAFDLAKKGYRITVFESAPEPGGMMRIGIPSFRLNKSILRDEIKLLEDAGIEIKYNITVGRNPSIEDLFNNKYEAVLLAVGARRGTKLSIENNNAELVYDAVSFMEKVNSGIPVEVGEKPIIIGAGSVAVDTARTLRRLGSKEVTCVCIEDDDTMPAPCAEIEEAQREGVKFVTCAAPTRIDAEWITVKGVEFKKVDRIEVDSCGRLKPITIDDEKFYMEGDMVIFATGQVPDLNMFKGYSTIKFNEAGRLIYDENTMMTSMKRVFVAGDVIEARGSVTKAMASGRKAALQIDNMLKDRNIVDKIDHELSTAPIKEMIYPVRLEKLYTQEMPKSKEMNFEEVELGYDEEQAILEAKRCMKCGYESVIEDRCIGCGVCTNVCPEDAISLIKVEREGK